MEITWLGILAIAILIFTGYGGYRKGLALAWMINPYVNDFMMKKHLHMNGYRKAVSI